jgi:hypothetical protein
MLTAQLTAVAMTDLTNMAKNSPHAFVEVDAKIGAVCNSGLTGEPLIAVVDSRYDVYLLAPASPGPPILTFFDTHASGNPRDLWIVQADVSLGSLSKTNLAQTAANHCGVIPNNIHVVP